MGFFLKLNWKLVILLTIFYALFVLSHFLHANSSASGTNNDISDDFNKRQLNIDASKNNIPSLIQSGNMRFLPAENSRQEIDSNGYNTAEAEGKSDIEQLRECLANVLLNAEKKEALHEQVMLSTAGALANDNCEGYGKLINIGLLEALENNTVEGDRLVNNIFAFCRYMDDKISELKIPDEEKAKLKVRIDELKLSTEKFGLLVSRPTKNEVQHRNCRILDVSDQLQVVVISAGFLDEIRPGLLFNVKQADNAVLKVIAVRPFVCAAVVISGKLGNINTGMPVEFLKK